MKQIFILLLAGLLTACASNDKSVRTDPTKLRPLENQLQVSLSWRQDLGRLTGSDRGLRPVLQDGKIFAASSNGKLWALSALDGSRLWRQKTGEHLTGGVAANDAVVVVGTIEAEVLAFDVSSGEAIWRRFLTSEVLTQPVIADGVVVVRTLDGRLTGLDSVSGEIVWTYDSSVPTLTQRGMSAPQITRNLVVTGFDNGRVVALQISDGAVFWERAVASPDGKSEIERIVDIDADPVIINNDVFAGSRQGRVAGLAIESGRPLWSEQLKGISGLAGNDQGLYVTDIHSRLSAIEKSSGLIRWQQESLLYRAVTAPAVQGMYVVAGDGFGYLHWFKVDSGDVAMRFRASRSAVMGAPLVAGGRLYVLTENGVLSCLEVSEP